MRDSVIIRGGTEAFQRLSDGMQAVTNINRQTMIQVLFKKQSKKGHLSKEAFYDRQSKANLTARENSGLGQVLPEDVAVQVRLSKFRGNRDVVNGHGSDNRIGKPNPSDCPNDQSSWLTRTS